MNPIVGVGVILLALMIIPMLIGATTDKPRGTDNPFRPMSDDEFVAECGPGAQREIAMKVRRIVAEQLNIPYEQIHPTHRFIEDLKAA